MLVLVVLCFTGLLGCTAEGPAATRAVTLVAPNPTVGRVVTTGVADLASDKVPGVTADDVESRHAAPVVRIGAPSGESLGSVRAGPHEENAAPRAHDSTDSMPLELLAQAGGGTRIVVPVGAGYDDEFLVAQGPRVYWLTRTSGEEARKYGPRYVVDASSATLPGTVTTMDVDEGRVLVGTSRGLVVLGRAGTADGTDVASDRELAVLEALDGPEVLHVARSGDRIVVHTAPSGQGRWPPRHSAVDVVRWARDGSLRVEASLRLPDHFGLNSMASSIGFVFLACRYDGLVVLDLRDPGHLQVMAVAEQLGPSQDLSIDFVAAGDGLAAVSDGSVQRIELSPAEVWRRAGPQWPVRAGTPSSWPASMGVVNGNIEWYEGSTLLRWAPDEDEPKVLALSEASTRSGAPEAILRDGERTLAVHRLGLGPYAPSGAPGADVPISESPFVPLIMDNALGSVGDVTACGNNAYIIRQSEGALESSVVMVTLDGADGLQVHGRSPQPSGYERLACSDQMVAMITTSSGAYTQVRLVVYDYSNPDRPELVAVREQSAAHCFGEDGRPLANRCGPSGAEDLVWWMDTIRADYLLDGPQWFDVSDPARPELLPGATVGMQRWSREESPDWSEQRSSAVASHGGYDYVVYPASSAAHPSLTQQTLTVLRSQAPDAPAEVVMKLDTPLSVVAATVESGGTGYLLASSSDQGLNILTLADPLHPAIVGHLELPAAAQAIAVEGDRVWIAVGEGGLLVYRVVAGD